MSLEKYCHDRLVVLSPLSSTYEAGRAMGNNHVGAVLIEDRRQLVGVVTDRDLALKVVARGLDPRGTRLFEVMTAAPETLPIEASEVEALELMSELHLRRLAVTDEGELAGIVTLDDLIISGAATREAAKAIILGQLSEGAPAKPEGFVHPMRLRRRVYEPEQRHRAHRSETLHRFAKHLMARLGLDNPGDAIEAFEVVARHLVRRLTPAEAQDFSAQLPMTIRERLLDVRAGPDRGVTRATIEETMARRLGVSAERAEKLVAAVGRSMGDFISEGELDDVRSQLPAELRQLLSRAA